MRSGRLRRLRAEARRLQLQGRGLLLDVRALFLAPVLIGFDLGRTSNPPERLASATGIINQAGFLASLVLVIAIGVILDWRTPGSSGDYTPSAFRWAMSFQYLLWTIGLVQIVRYRVLARARLRRDDPDLWAELSGRR